jgi:DNA-binding MarR family transcriptional regulator
MKTETQTPRQQAVLEALDSRPDYWITEASDLAEKAGLTDRGTLIVLYHLSDAGIVEYTESGWKRKESE